MLRFEMLLNITQTQFTGKPTSETKGSRNQIYGAAHKHQHLYQQLRRRKKSLILDTLEDIRMTSVEDIMKEEGLPSSG